MSHSIIVNLSFLLTQPTGISTYAANLIPYLQSLKPVLLTAKQFTGFNCYSIPDNLTPAEGSKGHLRRLLWTQWQLPPIYRQLDASLLFSPVSEAPLYSKCRYVVMCHDLIPLRFPQPKSPLSYYFRYVAPLVLRQAEHIICNSQATAKDIAHFYQINPNKITPILLAYDEQHFRPLAQPKSKNTPPYFLYLGRHDPYKNLHRLIAAFAAIPNCQDYQLWLAGASDQRYTPKLQQQAAELGISDQVKFLDYVAYEKLPLMLNSAIALVFPTLWEGFGLPVLEAMACGTPVITSNLASLPEITGEAAILIDPYDTAAITAAMTNIANDESWRTRYGQLSLAQASKFSWAKTGMQTMAVLSRFA